MRYYTAKGVAEFIGLTDRRVRQLRDKGIIHECRPGLYELRPTVREYIEYLRGDGPGRADLNAERTGLTRAKREAAELQLRLAKGELHETADIERAMKTMCLNFRTRALALPAKLAPELATMRGDQAAIFDRLTSELREILEELSQYAVAFAENREGPQE